MKHEVLIAPDGMRYTDGNGYYVAVYVGEGQSADDFTLVSEADISEKEEVEENV